jgi:hypothetical protein
MADETETAEVAPAEEPVDMELVGLFDGVSGYSYVHVGETRQRRISYGGANYEHVADDVHGRWLYRQM